MVRRYFQILLGSVCLTGLGLPSALAADHAADQPTYDKGTISIGGSIGSGGGSGDVNLTLPLVLSSNGNLMFLGVDGRLYGDTGHGLSYDTGAYIGDRFHLNDAVVGAWVGVDQTGTSTDIGFNRAIAGLEYFGPTLIGRLNGFVPFSGTVIDPKGLYDYSSTGLDGEVGLRFDAPGTSGMVKQGELRVFAGSYYYFEPKTIGHNVLGSKARAELDLYPFDSAPNTRLSFDAGVTTDGDVGTQFNGGIHLSFPLGITHVTQDYSSSAKDPMQISSDSYGQDMMQPVSRNTNLRFIGQTRKRSDRRLKRDIQHIATTASGIKLYSFKYLESVLNDDVTYVGVMAQDLEQSHPEALVVMPDGFYAVHYDLLGLRMITLKEWQTFGPSAVELTGLNAISQLYRPMLGGLHSASTGTLVFNERITAKYATI